VSDEKSDLAEVARDIEEVRAELSALNDAHLQNETTRDAFLALAHTALFAASVSFVSDLIKNGAGDFLWLLLVAWISSVVGLSALTASYSATARLIKSRQDQVYSATVKEPKLANILNSIALWSFPVALLSTFAFAGLTIFSMPDERPPSPPPAVVPTRRGVTPPQRAPGPNTGVTPAPRVPAPPPPPPPPSKD
jgi:hypothetical protein